MSYVIRNGKTYFDFQKGVSVEIEAISPGFGLFLLQSFDAGKPQPPSVSTTNEVGQIFSEINAADPDYLEALANFEKEREQKSQEMLVDWCVKIEVDELAIAKIRRFLEKHRPGVKLPEDSKLVYVLYYLPSSVEEYNQFFEALNGRSKPAERAVAAALESFSAKA